MKPYYDDGVCTIYHGDCLPILKTIDPKTVDLLLTDPPYGVNERTNRRDNGRDCLARCNNFPAVHGDDRPFDPAPLLRYHRVVMFGANHFADRVPPSPSWIVWDKVDGLPSKRPVGFNDNADCELAWTNLGGPARIVHHRWLGAMKASEHGDRRVHPTQKPIALMERIIEWRSEPDDLVLDPYMGSGPVAVACQRLGRRYIGIEIEERYCEVAAKRLSQEPLRLDVA